MSIEGIRRTRAPKDCMFARKSDHNSSRRNFRRAKYAVGYGAAALLGVYAASIGSASMFPANAQTITLQTDCKTYKPGELGAETLCVLEQDRLATLENKAAHARLDGLKKQDAAEDVVQACMKQLVAFKTRSPEDFAKLGRITRENACLLAKGLPPQPTAATARPAAG